jgi:hypothetical protein
MKDIGDERWLLSHATAISARPKPHFLSPHNNADIPEERKESQLERG